MLLLGCFGVFRLQRGQGAEGREGRKALLILPELARHGEFHREGVWAAGRVLGPLFGFGGRTLAGLLLFAGGTARAASVELAVGGHDVGEGACSRARSYPWRGDVGRRQGAAAAVIAKLSVQGGSPVCGVSSDLSR